MRGKPAGSPISWRRLRWFGEGEPGIGDVVLSRAGHAAYLVEEVTDTGRTGSEDGRSFRLYRLECTKLDPDEIEEPDWVITFY